MSDQQHETQATPDEKIAHQAKTWRVIEKAAIADKRNPAKQQQEYRARQQLRRVIDDVVSP